VVTINCKNSVSLKDLIPSNIEEIKSLELTETNALVDIKDLSKAKNLEYFAAKNYWMDYNSNKINLSPLTDLKYLKNISIEGWLNIDAKPLTEITTLQSLSISHFPENIDQISVLSNLESLKLNGAKSDELGFIKNIKSLKNLEIDSKIDSWISALSNLESLKLIDGEYTKELEFINNLKSLKNLEIVGDIDPWNANLDILNSLTNLRLLYWPIHELPKSLNLKYLENLTLCKGNETEEEEWDISPLIDSPNLKNITLNLHGDEIMDFNPLTKLKNLTHLKLIGLQPLVRFEFVNHIDNLKQIEIEFWDISDIDEVEYYNELKDICGRKNIHFSLKEES
jgi:hypothetical protein